MKKIAFLIGGVMILWACKSENKSDDSQEKEGQRVENSDDFQQELADTALKTKWNGEYLKVQDEEEEKKVTRKSLGSDFYSMGKVDLEIGGENIVFDLFEKKKNVLTFTTETINAFISSAFSESINVKFKKKEVFKKAKGEYSFDADLSKNKSMNMKLERVGKEKNKTYTMVSGKANILDFSPRIGTLELNLEGVFEDNEGNQYNGSGRIKMRFEEAIMTAL